tara:strand:- start:773 stop:1282 length:510 start_codon:yes stop_codon:yes gene_type:complete
VDANEQGIRRVADVDWERWTVEERDTLLFVVKDGRVLLIRKKRGLGAGNINGPGGHIEAGETPIECAIRETREELCITPLNVEARGEHWFHSDDFPHIVAYVFVATDYHGTPTETDEAVPHWFAFDDIPYAEMWEDDRYWLPQVLAGKRVMGRFVFTGKQLLDYTVEFE